MNNQDKNEIQANTLTDLQVTVEQANQTKGGIDYIGSHALYQDTTVPSLNNR